MFCSNAPLEHCGIGVLTYWYYVVLLPYTFIIMVEWCITAKGKEHRMRMEQQEKECLRLGCLADFAYLWRKKTKSYEDICIVLYARLWTCGRHVQDSKLHRSVGMDAGDASEPRSERISQLRPLLKGGELRGLRGRMPFLMIGVWPFVVPENVPEKAKNWLHAHYDKRRQKAASTSIFRKKSYKNEREKKSVPSITK